MTLEQLISKIERLKGLWLQPLGRARRIKVLEIDRKNERVVLQVEGESKSKSRPFSEFEALRGALESRPAVHVDSVLSGSGSSRNQPETVLANLPGIEYLRIDGRKHLATVSDQSRAYGTVREMDPVKAHAVAVSLADAELVPVASVLLVDPAFIPLAHSLASKLELVARAAGMETVVVGSRSDGVFVASPSIGLPSGCYPVFDMPAATADGVVVNIAGTDFTLVSVFGANCLFRRQSN